MSGEKKDSVSWDEATIAEHDKLRGSRMKIEEPNTPYNHEYVESQETKPEAVEDDGTVTKYYEKARIKCFIEVQRVLIEKKSPLVKSKGISIEWKALEAKLVQVEHNKEVPRASVKAKNDDFRDHRKEHYNEFQKMKEFRERQAQGLDDGDEEEEEKKA